MDINVLLKERLDIEKSKEIKAPTKTFAEITASTKSINTRVPKLIVKNYQKNLSSFELKVMSPNT